MGHLVSLVELPSSHDPRDTVSRAGGAISCRRRGLVNLVVDFCVTCFCLGLLCHGMSLVCDGPRSHLLTGRALILVIPKLGRQKVHLARYGWPL